MSTAIMAAPATITEGQWPRFGYITLLNDAQLERTVTKVTKQADSVQYKRSKQAGKVTSEVQHLTFEKWYRTEYSKKEKGLSYLSLEEWDPISYLKYFPQPTA